jgi:hypothetical protein
VQDAKDAIAEAAGMVVQQGHGMMMLPAIRLGSMTQAQLLDHARGMGLEPPKSSNKGKLLTLILEAGKVQRTEAKVGKQLQPDSLDAKLDAAFGPVSTNPDVPQYKVTGAKQKVRRDQKEVFEVSLERSKALPKASNDKSQAKASAFWADADRLGWTCEAKTSAGRVTITARRGEESIEIEWADGVFTGECFYVHNGRSAIKVHNASAAKKRMAIVPSQAAVEAQNVTARKAARVVPAVRRTAKPNQLPFTEASLDQEVLDALYGRRIKWTNRVSGAEEDDVVPEVAAGVRLADGTRGVQKQQHAPRIKEGKSGRLVEFVGAMGFRSVLLSQVTEVK